MRQIDLSGPDGNAFALIGIARNWAKQLGKDATAITAEMIETVIGPVQAARPVIDETTADGQASPGLSNVHY